MPSFPWIFSIAWHAMHVSPAWLSGTSGSISRVMFPANMMAGMFNFDEMARFEAEEGSEKAPTVDFS